MNRFDECLTDAHDVFTRLAMHKEQIYQLADLVEKQLLGGNKLLFCGNGGSANDGAHIATEFSCRFKEDRAAFPAISLGMDGGLLTAIANDYDFQTVFARQVAAFGKSGDILFGMSTSGRSRNVLEALEEARRRGLHTVVLLGRGGGFSTGVAEFEFIVEGKETARIQEAQMFLLHVLCDLVDERLAGGGGEGEKRGRGD